MIAHIAISPVIRAQGLKDPEKNIREAYKLLLKETDKNKEYNGKGKK